MWGEWSKDGNISNSGATAAGRSSCNGRVGTSCDGVRGPRRWIVLPGMVGAVYCRAGIRRARVLLLSTVKSESRGRIARCECQVGRRDGSRRRVEAPRTTNDSANTAQGGRTSSQKFVREDFADDCGAFDVSGVTCFVYCAAVHGHQRWAVGVVLSQLFSGGDGGGVLSRPGGAGRRSQLLYKFANCDTGSFGG